MLSIEIRDNDELAATCQRSVYMDRVTASTLGRDAVSIGNRGAYTVGDSTVDISSAVVQSVANTKSYEPYRTMPDDGRERDPERITTVEIANITSLTAAKEIVEGGNKAAVLNFANPVYPGGGFLRGARAQEESLCRSSALYRTIEHDEMYAWHHDRADSRLASEWCIWSPDVPVFRTDAGELLPEPWLMSVVTCAAPQADYATREKVRELMTKRIHRALDVFRAHHATHIVLGAWGCGAFGCNPDDVAEIFVEALRGPFDGVFDHVCFAIADWSEERRNLGPFARAFGGSA